MTSVKVMAFASPIICRRILRGALGDDVLELRVVEDATGGMAVQFRQINQQTGVNGTATNLGTIYLSSGAPLGNTIPAGTQIVLHLNHIANSNNVTASYDILDANGVIQTNTFLSGSTFLTGGQPTNGVIFSDESYARAEVHASSPATNSSYLTTGYGTFSIDATGAYTYATLNGTNGNSIPVQRLAAGQTVTDSFGVQVTDDGVSTATKTGGFTLTGVNDGAVATNDSLILTSNTLSAPLGSLLKLNDDIDGGDTFSITSVLNQSNGTVNFNSGDPTFTLNNGATSGSFQYKDSTSATTTATANIQVRSGPGLIGGNGNDTIVSNSPAITTMTGGNNADNFVFKSDFGTVTVTDYKPSIDQFYFDHTAFSSVFPNVAAIIAATHDDANGNAVISHDTTHTITLTGVSTQMVTNHQNDFHLL